MIVALTPPSPVHWPDFLVPVGAAAAGVVATVLVYAASLWLYRRVRHPLANPVLVTIAALILLLVAMDVDYRAYETGGGLIGLLLGPAVVALGLPLHLQMAEIIRRRRAILVATLAGATIGILAGVLAAVGLGASRAVALSLTPRSVTTPIAVGIAEQVGGIPPLAATVVIATGVLGAVIGPWVLRRSGIRSRTAFGLAMGASAHGAGTARALEEGAVEGATSGLAIGLMGVATAVLAPLLLAALSWLGLLS